MRIKIVGWMKISLVPIAFAMSQVVVAQGGNPPGGTPTTGHYDVTYSWTAAGTGAAYAVTIVGDDEIEWGYEYSPSGSFGGHLVYGGSGITSNEPPMPGMYSSPTEGTVVCQGQIKATFIWDDEGDANNLPPKSAIVYQESNAWWTGDSGSASNGLGDLEHLGGSLGSKVHVELDPGATFDVVCSPTVNAEETDMLDGMGSTASVLYRAEATPVFITMAGADLVESVYHPHMGQGCKASVNATGYTLENYAWGFATPSTEPNFFHHIEKGTYGYDPDLGPYWSYRRIINPTAQQYNEPDFQIYWGEDGTETLRVTADVKYEGVVVGSITAKRGVLIHEIDFEQKEYVGNSAYGTSPDRVYTSGSYPGAAGAFMTAKVETPLNHRSNGSGTFSWCQLITLDRHQWYGIGFSYSTVTNPKVLDNSFPYMWPDGPWDADYIMPDGPGDVSGHFTDSPLLGFKPQAYYYYIIDKYYAILIFAPPSHPTGIGTAWVALEQVEWNWTIIGTESGGTWSGPAGNDVTIECKEKADPRAIQWEEVFNN